MRDRSAFPLLCASPRAGRDDHPFWCFHASRFVEFAQEGFLWA